MEKFKNIDKAGVIRLAFMILALINQALVMVGKPPISFNEQEVEVVISVIFTLVTGIIGWYYNNPTSKANVDATHAMRKVKKDTKVR